MKGSGITLDSNGYNPSLLNTEQGTCYLCKREGIDTARHEIMFGTGNRQLAKKYGVWCNLCPSCHDLVHKEKRYNLMLKEVAQIKFEKKYSRPQWMDTFGRSYL